MRKIQKIYGKQEFGNLFEAKTVTKFFFNPQSEISSVYKC